MGEAKWRRTGGGEQPELMSDCWRCCCCRRRQGRIAQHLDASKRGERKRGWEEEQCRHRAGGGGASARADTPARGGREGGQEEPARGRGGRSGATSGGGGTAAERAPGGGATGREASVTATPSRPPRPRLPPPVPSGRCPARSRRTPHSWRWRRGDGGGVCWC